MTTRMPRASSDCGLGRRSGENGYFVPPLAERFGEMTADEARRAGDHRPHIVRS